MSDISDLVKVIERAIDRPAVPLDLALWSGDDIAVYLRRDRRTVMERLACLPDFPKAIKLPSPSGGKGQPLWVAKEIMEWARSYQEA
ncbi:MAG: hypothetical protein BGO99_09960 [Nitrosospira sp. 56-18]|jgi:hypothetical protein|nr:hypothetical protein [Nitrosospira sp.]OJY08818.1 MAG: hypothetical protein BGO99_09960 [Nitrosospira sp. 56-18]